MMGKKKRVKSKMMMKKGGMATKKGMAKMRGGGMAKKKRVKKK
jgi:hypothetical protein